MVAMLVYIILYDIILHSDDKVVVFYLYCLYNCKTVLHVVTSRLLVIKYGSLRLMLVVAFSYAQIIG